jgi:hypothetical protein
MRNICAAFYPNVVYSFHYKKSGARRLRSRDRFARILRIAYRQLDRAGGARTAAALSSAGTSGVDAVAPECLRPSKRWSTRPYCRVTPSREHARDKRRRALRSHDQLGHPLEFDFVRTARCRHRVCDRARAVTRAVARRRGQARRPTESRTAVMRTCAVGAVCEDSSMAGNMMVKQAKHELMQGRTEQCCAVRSAAPTGMGGGAWMQRSRPRRWARVALRPQPPASAARTSAYGRRSAVRAPYSLRPRPAFLPIHA